MPGEKRSKRGKPKERSNGEGTIYRDRNRWRGQLAVKGQNRKTFSGKTRNEVLEKINAYKEALKQETNEKETDGITVDDTTTVSEWIYQWLSIKESQVRQQSYNKTKSNLEHYIIPYIGDIKLQDLTREDIEIAYHTAFITNTKKNGEPYSENTIKNTSADFASCLKTADERKHLPKGNPHANVKRPRGRMPEPIEAYSSADQEQLVEYFKNSKNRADKLLYLLIATGMREGEAIALTWNDLDLKKKTITINKTLVYSNAGYIVQNEPKSKASNRTISISDKVVNLLKQLQEDIEPETNPKGLLIPNTKGNYYNPSYLRKRLQRICAELQIDYIDVHALRHSWVTRGLEKKIQTKFISDMVGHESVSITERTYQSVTRKSQEEVAKIMDDLI